MSRGFMTVSVLLLSGEYIELCGGAATYLGETLPIDELPQSVLDELLELGAIRQKHSG